jgi:murein DD-endopeptidase MepM/ murein hydrolase activator NlpD
LRPIRRARWSEIAPRGRRWGVIATAVAVASLLVSAGVAFAGGGGVVPPEPPRVSDVLCISTCGGIRKATTDSKVELEGRHLENVSKVLFNSKDGGRIRVDPVSVGSRAVKAKVPRGASTGRPKVADSFDNGDRSPTRLRIISRDQIPSSGNFKLRDASAHPRRSYYYSTKKPRVKYTFTNPEPTDVRINVVRRKDGAIVDSWVEPDQEPFVTHAATWNGVRKGTAKPARNGGYRFRVGPQSGTTESTTNSKFQFHRFKFPVRGPHLYGDGVGAPRVGHTHQGQDVAADCGTPLVAARGGRVQWNGYQAGGAGNYIVIDGRKTRHDYVYMHLRSRSRLHRGDRVKTGRRIGRVGNTGSSTGCHLHFEEWSGPGWYEGGHFMRKVTRHLKKWDSWS